MSHFHYQSAVMAAATLLSASLAGESRPPVNVGAHAQLLADGALIDRRSKLRFVVNPPRKAGRVLAPEMPWEEHRIFVVQVLTDGDVYRMWYQCMPAAGPSKGTQIPCGHCKRRVPDTTVVCHHCGYCVSDAIRDEFFGLYAYAESKDGLSWHRPELGVREFRGSRKNNLVARVGPVMIDPKPRDGVRYLAIGGAHAPSLMGSKDGFLWRVVAERCTPFICDTANQILWDPNVERYVAYLRGFPGRRTVVQTETADPYKTPWPHKPGVDLGAVRADKYITTEMTTVLDGKDFGTYEIYNPCVHIYPNRKGGVYFAFPTVYRAYRRLADRPKHRYNQMSNDGSGEVHVFVSRDGKHFTLPARTPYVTLGTDGEPDCGYLQMAVGMVEHGDEIYQYYTGVPTTHGYCRPDRERHLGGAFCLVQKRDRFVGLCADAGGGELVTHPLVSTGRRLEINVDCGGLGEARVEILDADGKAIPGFSLADADPIDLNQIHAACTWRGNADVAKLTGNPIRLRIVLRNATLYAFRFSTKKGVRLTS